MSEATMPQLDRCKRVIVRLLQQLPQTSSAEVAQLAREPLDHVLAWAEGALAGSRESGGQPFDLDLLRAALPTLSDFEDHRGQSHVSRPSSGHPYTYAPHDAPGFGPGHGGIVRVPSGMPPLGVGPPSTRAPSHMLDDGLGGGAVVNHVKCRHCSRVGHMMKHCPSIVCFQCHSTGHMSSVCPLAGQQPGPPPPPGMGMFHPGSAPTYDAAARYGAPPKNEWELPSGGYQPMGGGGQPQGSTGTGGYQQHVGGGPPQSTSYTQQAASGYNPPSSYGSSQYAGGQGYGSTTTSLSSSYAGQGYSGGTHGPPGPPLTQQAPQQTY